MRSLPWVLGFVAVLTWAVWQFGSTENRPVVAGHDWRRTTVGWEWVPQWRAPDDDSPLQLVVMAGLQLALSVLVYSSQTSERSPDQCECEIRAHRVR